MATIHSYQSSGSGIYAQYPKLSGFTILELLHEGSHSAIYRARQDRLGRIVVLKMLPEWPPPTDVALERFNRAAFVSAQVPHPNLLTLYDTGTKDGYHYVSLEFISGQTLQKYISDAGPADERFAMHAGLQLLRALSALHDHDICHRNIKPKNIMVEPNGNLRLLGLGLASCKRAFFSPHLDARVIGTPHFMAPEMVRGSYSDPRSDLYALGITLFVATTGSPPFEKGPPAAVMARHLTDVPTSLAKARPDLSREFVEFVHTLMAQDLALRFTSAHVALEACEALCRRQQKNASSHICQIPPNLLNAKNQKPAAPAAANESLNCGQDVCAPYGNVLGKVQKSWKKNRLALSAAAAMALIILGCYLVASAWSKGSAVKPIPTRVQENDENTDFQRITEHDDAFISVPSDGVEAWTDYLSKYPNAPVSHKSEAKVKLEIYTRMTQKALRIRQPQAENENF